MVDALPDGVSCSTGSFDSAELGVHLGWKVPRESFSDCLPAWNEKKDCVLFFLGEHFADKNEVTDLKARNHSVGKPNASYLVHMYEEKGDSFVRELSGSFCGVVLDFRTRNGIVFSDRLGLQRLYYHEENGALYFATEVASLLEAGSVTRALEAECLGEWLAYGFVLENRTLFNGVFRFPLATIYRFWDGGFDRWEKYFDFEEWENQTYLGCDYFEQRLESSLSKVFSRYTRGQQDAALCTDELGSLLYLSLADVPRGKMPLLSFNETHVGKSGCGGLASELGQSSHVHRIAINFPDNVHRFAEEAVVRSGGFADFRAALALERASWASEIAPVLLSGGFFFEVFAGQLLFEDTGIYRALPPDMIQECQHARLRVRDGHRGHPLSDSLRLAVAGRDHAGFSVATSRTTVRTPFTDPEVLSLLYRIPIGSDWAFAAALRILQRRGQRISQGVERDRRASRPSPHFCSAL